MAYTMAMRDREDNFEALKDFQGRKLMICGDQDPAVPITVSRKHKDRVDDFVELEGCGHMGMFENKAASLNAIQSFLEKV
jgi:pimeloyl-ACP methyl ester carboxylesterase